MEMYNKTNYDKAIELFDSVIPKATRIRGAAFWSWSMGRQEEFDKAIKDYNGLFVSIRNHQLHFFAGRTRS